MGIPNHEAVAVETVAVETVVLNVIIARMLACACVRSDEFAGSVRTEPCVGQRHRLMIQHLAALRDPLVAGAFMVKVPVQTLVRARLHFCNVAGWATDLHDILRWNRAVDGAVLCEMWLTSGVA